MSIENDDFYTALIELLKDRQSGLRRGEIQRMIRDKFYMTHVSEDTLSSKLQWLCKKGTLSNFKRGHYILSENLKYVTKTY